MTSEIMGGVILVLVVVAPLLIVLFVRFLIPKDHK